MNAQFRTEELFGFNVHFQEEFLIDVGNNAVPKRGNRRIGFRKSHAIKSDNITLICVSALQLQW